MILQVMMVLVSIVWNGGYRARCALSLVGVFGGVNDASHVWRVLINLRDEGVVFLRGSRVLFVFECDLLGVVFDRNFLLWFVGDKRWWFLVRSSEASHRYFRRRLSGSHKGGFADRTDNGVAVQIIETLAALGVLADALRAALQFDGSFVRHSVYLAVRQRKCDEVTSSRSDQGSASAKSSFAMIAALCQGSDRIIGD